MGLPVGFHDSRMRAAVFAFGVIRQLSPSVNDGMTAENLFYIFYRFLKIKIAVTLSSAVQMAGGPTACHGASPECER
jgi:hypothetical protein